ncbi:hypothetical protein L226DRAFT_547924 [Lentinus tigrinus ALCF2SS1-7]|uniref:N-acetyltransferase domain-containing protein n=1 Tax=Lentinus tigrinus ALCF2SS1-6 TaxID=1328759 RepID=A0A5C2RSF2_9APHY|nr:hypothetical protein L227DRAFT_534455 [Lentinus tigrinus ALCF2SS1-6]RPD70036.1 hypothetical protein L226DRAFT_547924 [Lentinus tigrinus ALCF2SS1-7]
MAPSNVTIEFVEQPTESLTEECVAVFSSVMGADPCSIALTGGDLSLIPSLGRTIARSIALCPGVGHLYIARDDAGDLIGFTLFTLPGQLMGSTKEQQVAGKINEYLATLSPEGQAYFAEAMAKDVPKANDEMIGIKDTERETYWCNMAMVHKDYQGKGVAKAMFQLAFKEAAKTGATMALTTTNIINVPIYEKIGFKYHGEKTMPSPWLDWKMWFFSRDTQSEK